VRRKVVYVKIDGEQVRSLRKERGLSRQEFAEASGVGVSTLHNVETGKTYARPSTARKIADALGVDPRSLATVAPRA
jgi:XRE family transcriptional regulator, fatty acid utilization regulator